MCREKAERRCHREGYRELPGAPSFPVTDSGAEKKQGGKKAKAAPLQYLRRILVDFLCSLRGP